MRRRRRFGAYVRCALPQLHASLRRSVGVGEKAMTRRLAKIIQFGAKRRNVHVRVLATGDLIRVLSPLRRPPVDDEGPRAA